MGYLAYIMVLVLVVCNAIAMYLVNRKRAKLDVTNEADQKKDKRLRLVITILCVDTVVISAIIILVLKPMLGAISD
jgi:heme/copper-type cytochrome/quinol oxidase subunit 2